MGAGSLVVSDAPREDAAQMALVEDADAIQPLAANRSAGSPSAAGESLPCGATDGSLLIPAFRSAHKNGIQDGADISPRFPWHGAIEALRAKLQPRPLGFADPLEEPVNQSSIESISARLHLDNDRAIEIDVSQLLRLG